MRKINKIKLFVNDNDKSRIVAKDLELELIKYGFKVVTKGKYDLAISVGGDGSFLRMIKETAFNDEVYYIGVNSGTLGFLQEIDIKNCSDFVKRLNINDFREEHISIQKTKIITEDEVYIFSSLNEITIRAKDFNVLKMDVFIDNSLLEHFTGDGILASTATGSTAYNMSFGGSIVYNSLNTLSIVPIAPISNKVYHTLMVPIIVPNNNIVSFVPSKENQSLEFKIDGENKCINKVLRIDTLVSDNYIKCIRMNDFHFIKVVSDKIIGN